MDFRFITKAEQALSGQDPALGKLIAGQELAARELHTDYFASLCRSIIGQQVSVAAAAAIFGRFEERTSLKPHAVASLTEADTKAIGLSRQKTGYLQDLAVHFIADPAVYDHLDSLSDEDVIKELIAVKGIGAWTAQMFLMFTLFRPDVFAVDDVGLQHGMQKLYGWNALPPKTELVAVAERWRPYRTVACLHLWQSLNNTPG